MTFLELQEAVIADRFNESKRDSVKSWINSRYGRLWASEPWAFKFSTYTLTGSAQTLPLSTPGFQTIHAVYRGEYSAYSGMTADLPTDFYSWATDVSGKPLAFTVIGNTLRFDRPLSSSETFTILGELSFDPLVADLDVPLIPEEFHYMLVHGANAIGLAAENDPGWQSEERLWDENEAEMKRVYLKNVKVRGSAPPGWP